MSDDTTVPELERQLLYALLRPAAALCRRFRVPLDSLEQLCRLAYYEALREGEGATQAEVAEAFGKSLRTVVSVEKQFRSDFLAPADAVKLSRRCEEVIATGPRSAAEVAAHIGADEAETRRALEALAAASRARVTTDGDGSEPRYELKERLLSLVRDDLRQRLDGLRHQLETISAAVSARFFDAAERPVLARTLSFVGAHDEVRALTERLVRHLRMEAIDVEEKALTGADYERFALTIAIAPTDRSPE